MQEKPWCMTTVMFCGMSFCLPLAFFMEYRQRKKAAVEAAATTGSAQEPLLPDGVRQPASRACQQQQAVSFHALQRVVLALRGRPPRRGAGGDVHAWPSVPKLVLHCSQTCAGTLPPLQIPKQEPAPKSGHSELAQAAMLFIPTAFDLIATVLMNVGLLSGAQGLGSWQQFHVSWARHGWPSSPHCQQSTAYTATHAYAFAHLIVPIHLSPMLMCSDCLCLPDDAWC